MSYIEDFIRKTVRTEVAKTKRMVEALAARVPIAIQNEIPTELTARHFQLVYIPVNGSVRFIVEGIQVKPASVTVSGLDIYLNYDPPAGLAIPEVNWVNYDRDPTKPVFSLPVSLSGRRRQSGVDEWCEPTRHDRRRR